MSTISERIGLSPGVIHAQGRTYVSVPRLSAHDEFLRWCLFVEPAGCVRVDKMDVLERYDMVVYTMAGVRYVTRERPAPSHHIRQVQSYLTFIAEGGASEPRTDAEASLVSFVRYDPRCIPVMRVEAFAIQSGELVLFNPVSHNDATVLVTQ